MTGVTKPHSSDRSDEKNAVIKFNVSILPETYIPFYVTVVTVVTEVTLVTVVRVVRVVRVVKIVKKKKILSLLFLLFFCNTICCYLPMRQ